MLRRRICPDCCSLFSPLIKGQERCLTCIMSNEPPKPPDEVDKDDQAFAEWFIYHWQNIRSAAQVIKDREKGDKSETGVIKWIGRKY